MTTKTEIDYLNYDDLNEVEAKIKEYTDEVSKVTDIPSFKPKNWVLNELPYVQEIDRIENGIFNLGEYYNRPRGWMPDKKWITPDNPYPIKGFDYRDYNRWLNNLNLFSTDIDLTDTIWNGASFIYWNNLPYYFYKNKTNGYTKQTTYSGKNLLEPTTKETIIINGVHINPYYRNGLLEYINVWGTPTADVTQSLGSFIPEPNVKYKINGTPADSNLSTCYISVTGDINVAGGQDVSASWADGNIRNYNVVIKTREYIDMRFYPMIRLESETDATYEPYTGRQPLPNPDYPQTMEVATGNVEVKSIGKNLFKTINPLIWIEDETFDMTVNEDGTITANGTTTTDSGGCIFGFGEEMKLSKGSYKLTGCPSGGGEDKYSITIIADDETGAHTYADFGEGITFTINNDINIFAGVQVAKGQTVNNLVFKPMIRLASITNEAYEPYKESKVTYNLGENYLADKDYIENGVLNKNISKIVLNGSEISWGASILSTNGEYLRFELYDFENIDLYKPHNEYKCDNFTFKYQDGLDVNEEMIANTTNSSINRLWIWVRKDRLETPDTNGFKTFLSKTPVTAYYELKTPEQSQLETTGKLEVYAPVTTVINSIDTNMEVIIKNYKNDEDLTKTGNDIKFNIEEIENDIEWEE